MEKPVLSDPAVYPSEEVLFPLLGKSRSAFIALFDFNHSRHADYDERWKYYTDGKRWLMSVSRRKKTLFWLAVCKGYFRVTFYINSRFEQNIIESRIPKVLKQQYADAAEKRIRGISLLLKSKKDVDVYKELLSIKLLSV